MGIPVESTLDFNDTPSDYPSTPSNGVKLWLFEDNTLHVLDLTGTDRQLQTTDLRGRGVWYTSETGTPLPPSNIGSPLNQYVTSILVGDYIVRESDGEVFQLHIGVGTPGNVGSPYPVDLGFTTQGALRGPATWFTTETGTPAVPTNSASPFYPGTKFSNGDYIIRDSDGEVFQYSSSGSGSVTDLGFSTMGGNNAVTNTIARATIGSAKSLASGQSTIPFDTVSFDPGSCFNTASYSYIAPVAGYYRATAQVQLAAVITAYTRFLVNGSPLYDASEYEASSPNNAVFHTNDVVKLNAGDSLAVGIVTSAAGSIAANSNSLFSAQLIAPLTSAPVNATPNTGARAYRSAAFTPPAAGYQKIPIDTVSSDSGGHMDVVTNNRYNVATPGLYSVMGQVSASVASGESTFAACIYKNGVLWAQGTPTRLYNSAAETAMVGSVSDLVPCVAGDYIELWYYNNTVQGLDPGSANTFLSVVKVDQPSQLQVANGAWQTPTLLNSWVNTGGVYQTARYMKDALGFVHVEGTVQSGASGTTIFTLPAGYRPASTLRFGFYALAGGAMLTVDSSGNVSYTSSGGVSPSLDCITFLAEN